MAINVVPSQLSGGTSGGGSAGDSYFTNQFMRAYTTDANSSFGESNRLNRYFGDVYDVYMDPYTTGYGYVIWEKIPRILKGFEKAGLFLTAIAKSFTMPSVTVNVIEYNGLNNLKWGVPGTVEWDSQTFTVRMEEYRDAPVMQLIGRWATMIRDLNYGIANMSDYTQSAYKGRVLYASTDPSGHHVMFAALFTGVFPTRVPLDALNFDVTTQDKVEPDFEFHFDMVFVGDETVSLAQSRVDSLADASISALKGVYSVG